MRNEEQWIMKIDMWHTWGHKLNPDEYDWGTARIFVEKHLLAEFPQFKVRATLEKLRPITE